MLECIVESFGVSLDVVGQGLDGGPLCVFSELAQYRLCLPVALAQRGLELLGSVLEKGTHRGE
jgi:hypothetical protein